METKQQPSGGPTAQGRGAVDTLACPNCHAALLPGMRFCRGCGCRLGEGIAEYVETMRFDGANVPVPAYAPPQQQTMTQAAAPPTTTLGPMNARRRGRFCGNSPWRMSWMIWLLIAISFSSIAGGGSVLVRRLRDRVRSNITRSIAPPRSFFGTAGGFTSVDGGGVMIDAAVPNSPADRAGLVGGDIITSFDGHAVADSDSMTRLLRRTPIGKAVEVVYTRDGVSKVTTLIVGSSADFSNNFGGGANAPQGYLGVDDYKRVLVPGADTYGVRVDTVERNNPADLAGLRSGDIVVEFNGTPIRTTDEFESRIHRAAPGETANVVVVRNGQQQAIPIKMGRR